MLGDQPTYPLAYHAMSVAALARALAVLGADAPAPARDAFRRAMLAQASFTAPDGDLAYLGRAQGESWALGATAYAGQYCAATFARTQPADRRDLLHARRAVGAAGSSACTASATGCWRSSPASPRPRSPGTGWSTTRAS